MLKHSDYSYMSQNICEVSSCYHLSYKQSDTVRMITVSTACIFHTVISGIKPVWCLLCCFVFIMLYLSIPYLPGPSSTRRLSIYFLVCIFTAAS